MKTFITTISFIITNCFSSFCGNPITISSSVSTSRDSIGIGYLLYLSPEKNTMIYYSQSQSDKIMKNILVSNYNLETNMWDILDNVIIDNSLNKSIGKEIFFSYNDGRDKDLYSFFYYNGKCTVPKKLNNINTKYNESFAFITQDKNTLYFTSDRIGGYGGYDIWKSEKLENGDWGIAQNLGKQINTEFDEESPVILYDNATLYFSSKGHNSIGGFDIFVSTLSDEGFWSTSESSEINTPNDDMYYFLSKDEKNAYYTLSKKGDGIYIYEISFN